MNTVTKQIVAVDLLVSLGIWVMADSTDAFQYFQEEAMVVTASHHSVSRSWAPATVKDMEVYIVRQNLTSSIHQEYADNLLIPRTYQGGVSIKCGGRS
jgi:hypothetical protein